MQAATETQVVEARQVRPNGVGSAGFVIDKLATVSTIGEAIDRFYKGDRLKEPGTRDRLVASREDSLADANAWRILPDLVLLISHRESVTGRAIYGRAGAGEGLEIVQAFRQHQ